MEQRENKNKLTYWVDYYLRGGGKYSEIKEKITEKAVDLNHGGYKFPGQLFSRNGNFQHKTFLGHIAHLAIDKNLTIKIGELHINPTIAELASDEKQEMNNVFNNLCNNSDPYIIISNSKEKQHIDREHKLYPSIENDFPDWLYCKSAIDQITNELPTYDMILDQIEKNALTDNRKLNSNWREITRKNIPIWINAHNDKLPSS